MVNHSSHQTLGSRILAAALSEFLPGLFVEDVGVVCNGFYCDFSFSQPFSSEILVLLEERIRQIIREKRPIRVMEMIPFCAAEFLKKHGQNRRAAQVHGQDQYVPLIQIGSFVDWCEELPYTHTGEAGFVRLIEQTSRGRDRYRIIGVGDVSKDALKARFKLYQQFPDLDHMKRGADRGFWEVIDGERIWLPDGLEVRRRLCGMWRKNFSSMAIEVEGDERQYPLISEKKQKMAVMHLSWLEQPSRAMRGLLDDRHSLVWQIISFVDLERDCISFLQIVHKSLTILGFTSRIRFSGKSRKQSVIERSIENLGWEVDEETGGDESKLEFLVRDALQCEWVIAAIREPKPKGSVSATVWVERNLALLLEINDESLGMDEFPLVGDHCGR
ncbi:MAG: hypothetical protein HW387_32 [Parachlamydiales bacterium]|nr:hypothetical protein [Parachlamydiales bacterium]